MIKNPGRDPKAAAQVYFDGGCPVCSREIALYQRLSDHDPLRPQFCDIAASDAPPAADLKHADALARLHVRRADGALVSGAEAFLSLWRATPRFRLLGRVLSVPPMPWVLELAYRGFLKLRRVWR